MNNYDQIMFFLVNRLLQPFGMRIKENEEVVYLYKIQYNKSEGESVSSAHIVHLSKDVSDAFAFLKMDYKDYKAQDFKNIFEFSNYLVENCPYVTKQFILSLEKGLGIPTEGYEELISQLEKFVKYVKLAHITLREFQFVPIIMYANLKESIVRKFFNSDVVSNQFIDIKLRNLAQVELIGKFSGDLVKNWIHALRSESDLCNLFTVAFVEYITDDEPELFPRYLIDHDLNIIKKEVITFYNQTFPNTETYISYKLAQVGKEEVVT